MRKIAWLTLWLIAIGLGGYAGATGNNPNPELAYRFREIRGVEIYIDSASRHEHFDIRNERGRLIGIGARIGRGGQSRSFYSGDPLPIPEKVHVTWRSGVARMERPRNADGTTGPEQWIGGTIIGDYTISVAERIPDEILDSLRRDRKGALRIKFRLTDDDVLLGWDIERDPGRMDRQWLREYSQRTGLPSFVSVYEMAGGDFEEAKIYNGKVVGKGWYIDKKTGQKVWTDY